MPVLDMNHLRGHNMSGWIRERAGVKTVPCSTDPTAPGSRQKPHSSPFSTSAQHVWLLSSELGTTRISKIKQEAKLSLLREKTCSRKFAKHQSVGKHDLNTFSEPGTAVGREMQCKTVLLTSSHSGEDKR